MSGYFRQHLLAHGSLHAAEYFVMHMKPTKPKIALFVVEESDLDELVNDYVRSKLVPEFVIKGSLPLPR